MLAKEYQKLLLTVKRNNSVLNVIFSNLMSLIYKNIFNFFVKTIYKKCYSKFENKSTNTSYLYTSGSSAKRAIIDSIAIFTGQYGTGYRSLLPL